MAPSRIVPRALIDQLAQLVQVVVCDALTDREVAKKLCAVMQELHACRLLDDCPCSQCEEKRRGDSIPPTLRNGR